MEIRETNGVILMGGKVITTLGTFVASVSDIIEEHTDYVIVRGDILDRNLLQSCMEKPGVHR